MNRHVIAIPTFRRPKALVRALHAVEMQLHEVHPPDNAMILVIDNDPAGSGRATAESFGVQYVVEPSPGIAAVRNRALTECADAATVIFIDDDEAPEPGWLTALLSVYRRFSPTAVAGKVVTTFPSDTEEWVRASGAFIRPQRRHEQLMTEAATNNLLLDIAEIQRLGLRFDERFGLTGGSDSMFTRLLTARGGTIRWAEDAVVVEQEDAGRFTRAWVLMRTFRFGNTSTRVTIALADTAVARVSARARMAARGAVRIVGGAGRWVLGAVSGSLPHRARGLRTAYRGAGMVAAATGYAHDEYGRRRAKQAA
ncbi:glycosyltransferase family 2 protein [Microbacterium foliorum]|uniref:glycosyltransferase family 2 protein n=1 Tax=Microbacterium foliorum TaxID=104336 RepID=UPI00280B80B2|nr:glycosyltransferase [Microbacterium foliorum]